MRRGVKSSLEEMNYATKNISEWYRRNVKTLSVFTAPYNTNFIFTDIIIDVLKEKNNILYISGIDSEDSNLIDELKTRKKNLTYSHIIDGSGDTGITFVDYRDLNKISGKYKLVIIDEISKFSTLSTEDLRSCYEKALKIADKVIVYTIEPITPLGERLEIASIGKMNPYVEPRVITTRIDLNKDIPYILYDYLKWFRDSKSRIIIYTPSEEKLELAYNYYENKLKMDGVKIIKLSKTDDKKVLKNVLKIKDKAIFIVTDYMEDNLENSKIENAVILFADDIRYDYKKIVYLCGEIGRINKALPEVLFVSREVSESMDKVKDITRVFNKKLWERKLRVF